MSFHYIVITRNVAFNTGQFYFIIHRIHHVNKGFYVLYVPPPSREDFFIFPSLNEIFMNFYEIIMQMLLMALPMFVVSL